jgi:hypothetical protein
LKQSNETRLSAEEVYRNSVEWDEASAASPHFQRSGQKPILMSGRSIIYDHRILVEFTE